MRSGWRSRRLLFALVAATIVGAGLIWRARETSLEAALLPGDADAAVLSPSLRASASARAKRLYAAHCANCHGADLKGDHRFGAPNLIDADWLYGNGRASEIEQTLTFGIRSGNPKGRNLASMPAFSEPEPYARYQIPPLDPQDVRDVVEYIFVLGARPADPVAARRGDVIYHTRGGCYDCHGADGSGDEAIGAPNLKDAVWLYGDGSRAAIFETIAHGRAGACPAWIHRLSAADIRSLAIWIRARSSSQRPLTP